MNPRLKICGIKTKEIAQFIDGLSIDLMGFIFYEYSHRNISIDQAIEITQNLKTKKVAVTVDARDELLLRLKTFNPEYIQLHGNESYERAKEIAQEGFKVIKAVKVKDEDSISEIDKFMDVSEYILLDSYSDKKNTHGGTGKIFNWELIKDLKNKENLILSGGLNKDNIKDALNTGISFFDLSSGLELNKEKNKNKILEFMGVINEL